VSAALDDDGTENDGAAQDLSARRWRIVPEVGRSAPAIHLISVDLPAPF
jgi:hypothetical protein